MRTKSVEFHLILKLRVQFLRISEKNLLLNNVQELK